MNNFGLHPLLTTLMPVEAPDLAHLLQVRDQLMSARRGNLDVQAAPPPIASEEVIHVVDQGDGSGVGTDWRRSQFEQLRNWISPEGHCPAPGARYRGLHMLFDLTAAADGEWVTKAAAEQSADVSPRQLANELAALTKLCRKFNGTTTWPIQYREIGRIYSYRMDPAIATWWNNGSAK
jgi:hypothetical protein